MRYLWLAPAVITMGIAILFLLSSVQRTGDFSRRERAAYILVGLCLQAAALAAAAQAGS